MTVLSPVILTVADWGVSGKIEIRFELSSRMLPTETVAVPRFAAVKKSPANTPEPVTPLLAGQQHCDHHGEGIAIR